MLTNRFSLAARLHARLRTFADDKRGVAAVEFALIAAPFFFLIFGLLEVCMIFIMSAILDHGVVEASRPLRTGAAQQVSMTSEQFKELVCSELMDMMDCETRLHIDVQTVDSFSNTPTASPLNTAGELQDEGFGFNPGGPNDVVAVRVFYEWDLLTPGLTMPLANMTGNKHLLQTNAVFRNEPFGSESE
ncbi:pilus assembly protein [Hyphomonas sp. WL0036]|uniref:TadE/TadG family type IV pilus assembly protein n=1 Tax=Hyphomonas sediminis TaxID=2866160 RepID=UPI001C804C46|nr:TadE/TadG family type IV pilus assembly protein [Hyphomonas sediminis]MBY9066536.1 pilus assembly protein [Hyphomonas sediminis]